MSTMQELQERYKQRTDAVNAFVREQGMEKAETIRDFAEGKVAGDRFLYVEAGGKHFAKVKSCRRNGDVITWGDQPWFYHTWYGCPGDFLFKKVGAP